MFNVMAMASSSSYCRPSRLKRKGMPLESSSSSKQQSLLKTHYDHIDDEIDHEDEESQIKLGCYGYGSGSAFDFNLCVNCSTPLQQQQQQLRHSSTSSGRSNLAPRKVFRETETKSRPSSPPEATTTSFKKVKYSASSNMSIGRSLSDIYNLNYLDHLKQLITEDGTKEIPVQNLPLGLCQLCGSTLTDLIRLYSDFNSLRKADSFLSCQISELDQLISQLSIPTIPETSYHDNDNDSDNDSGTLPFANVNVKYENFEEESQCPSSPTYVSSFNYVQCNPKTENNNLDVNVNPGKSDNEENSDFEGVCDPLSFSVGPEYEDDESISEECKFKFDPSSNLSIDFFPYSDQTQTQVTHHENELECRPIIPNLNYASERETQISINARKGTKNKKITTGSASPSSVSDTGTGPTKNSFLQPRPNANAINEDVDVVGDRSERVRIHPKSKNKRQRRPTDQMRLKHTTFGKDNEETFKCPNCTKEYKLYNSFKSHVLVCSGERLPCKICGKEFRYRSGPFRCMKKHEQELRGR